MGSGGRGWYSDVVLTFTRRMPGSLPSDWGSNNSPMYDEGVRWAGSRRASLCCVTLRAGVMQR